MRGKGCRHLHEPHSDALNEVHCRLLQALQVIAGIAGYCRHSVVSCHALTACSLLRREVIRLEVFPQCKHRIWILLATRIVRW
jgi:hypothetical protein